VDRRYWPQQFDGSDSTPVSWLNEPALPNVSALAPRQRSIHAVLVENLNSARALLRRLELGVQAPPGHARVTVRELYVQTRRQVKTLIATLELEGLE